MMFMKIFMKIKVSDYLSDYLEDLKVLIQSIKSNWRNER